jgi:hypothetical protein
VPAPHVCTLALPGPRPLLWPPPLAPPSRLGSACAAAARRAWAAQLNAGGASQTPQHCGRPRRHRRRRVPLSANSPPGVGPARLQPCHRLRHAHGPLCLAPPPAWPRAHPPLRAPRKARRAVASVFRRGIQRQHLRCAGPLCESAENPEGCQSSHACRWAQRTDISVTAAPPRPLVGRRPGPRLPGPRRRARPRRRLDRAPCPGLATPASRACGRAPRRLPHTLAFLSGHARALSFPVVPVVPRTHCAFHVPRAPAARALPGAAAPALSCGLARTRRRLTSGSRAAPPAAASARAAASGAKPCRIRLAPPLRLFGGWVL